MCNILARKIRFDNAFVFFYTLLPMQHLRFVKLQQADLDGESKLAPLEHLTRALLKDIDLTEKDTDCCINLWLYHCSHSDLIKD